MQRPEFVHLHLHTDYSLLDGACEIGGLVREVARQRMPAVAVTDHGNLFAAVKFYHAAEAAGVKPILGCELYVTEGSRHERSGNGEQTHHLVVLCESNEGYHNLLRLVSSGFLEGFYYKPRVDKELLASHSRGLIALSACLRGAVASRLLENDYAGARQTAGELEEIFGRGNFFLELQDQGLELEHRIQPALLRLAQETGIALVATNDCHYLTPDDARSHDVLLCIQTGKTIGDTNRMRFGSDQFYLKTAEEMQHVFRAMPEAVGQTARIAERCQVKLEKVAHPFPRFEVPGGHTLESYFEKVAREGFAQRRAHLEALARAGRLRQALGVYEERLNLEIETIQRMRFAGYFLIIWDLMRRAREQRIPVGPGRGSAAGSLVSYALGITDIDPLQYNLLFERFLNPERISLPDIDIDFCMRRRGEVLEYVTQKYGRENVAQIITFGTLAAKAALKDVARALEIPYAEADRMAKLVPPVLNITLEQAVAQSPPLAQLCERDPKAREVLAVAKKLEGFARHASTHAAGVVISPQPLTDLVPLYKTNRDEVVTQYAMDDLEKIGLLKMDFLGLTTLTVVDDTLKLVAQNRGQPLRLEDIPPDDAETYALFGRGETSGVFQFESRGMREILRRYKPTRPEELIALNALYRPGPIQGGMIDDFIQRKHGLRSVTYELPELKEILEETYGVIVYQEQVMQIANRLAGFSLGEADILRRAMGKKKREEMKAQREKFIAGCKQNKIPEKKAARVFDLMAEFAGYGFNKSHSAAYALVAYQTAYLKTHYPVEFMSAVLTAETGNSEKVVKYIHEAREMGITVLAPDINESDWSFTPAGDAIRFGLGAVRNVGYNTVQAIQEARQQVTRFSSFYEFCDRVDLRVLNRRVLESLIKAGAMDSLGARRAQLYVAIDSALERAARQQRKEAAGQSALFSGESVLPAPPPSLPEADEWPEHERLRYEKEILGFYITGHPLARYRDRLTELKAAAIAELEERPNAEDVCLAGIVVKVRPLRSKKGERWAIATLEDMTGVIDLLVFPEAFARLEPRLFPDATVLVKGRMRPEESGMRIAVMDLKPLEEALPQPAGQLVIRLNLAQVDAGLVERLLELFQRKPGRAAVAFELEHSQEYRVRLDPRQPLRVEPDEELLGQVRSLCGENAVSVML